MCAVGIFSESHIVGYRLMMVVYDILHLISANPG